MVTNPKTTSVREVGEDLLRAIVRKALERNDVPVAQKDVAKTADKVVAAVDVAVVEEKIAIVPVKSSWASKINILNSAWLASVLGYFGINIPTDPEGWVAAILSAAVPFLTIILRSFFTRSVTIASKAGGG